MIHPWQYDGMVNKTADGLLRFRVYEPTRWQLLRRLRWAWWRVRSRFDTRVVLATITVLPDDGSALVLRVVVEPVPPLRGRRRY